MNKFQLSQILTNNPIRKIISALVEVKTFVFNGNIRRSDVSNTPITKLHVNINK